MVARAARWWTAVVASVGIVGVTLPTDACTCAPPPLLVILPTFAAAAPRNTHVYATLGRRLTRTCDRDECPARDVRLALRRTYETGDMPSGEVPLSVTKFATGLVTTFELVPTSSLDADATYEVWWHDAQPGVSPRILGRIRTGTELDHEPPRWAGIERVGFTDPAASRTVPIEMCGPNERRLEFEVVRGDAYEPEPASPGATMLGVWIGEDGSSHMNERPPTHLLMHDFDPASPKQWEVIAEDHVCNLYQAKLPGPGKTVHVGFKLVDLAGNASVGEERSYVTPKVTKKRP